MATPEDAIDLRDVYDLKSELDGCWFPALQAGDWFRKGDKLGHITDFFGNIRQTVLAPEDGVILYQNCCLGIAKGASPMVYGREIRPH